ncbi:MAG: slipin family protein [Armatimonadia bacterium]|nr:slipin family protein [Armatimonadia bacterium]
MGPLLAVVAGLFGFIFLYFLGGIRIVKQWERGVVLRFGRFASLYDPGLRFILPGIDKLLPVDLRIVALDVPKQEAITYDNVPVRVDAVVFFRVVEPVDAVLRIRNYYQATSQISQTTLRSVVGKHQLDQLLSEREQVNAALQEIIDEETDSWGVEVMTVEVKDVSLPESMQRAIARQAEAEREKRAKIIHADGERAAAENLAEASRIISENDVAIQLRFLQTLTEVAAEQNSTTIFPVPIDILKAFMDAAPGTPRTPREDPKSVE